MKKMLAVFLVFSIVYVGVSWYIQENADDGMSQKSAEAQQSFYVVKSINDKIVVLKDKQVIKKTDTSVNTLPKSDRNRLYEGIVAENEKEAMKILQDYCS